MWKSEINVESGNQCNEGKAGKSGKGLLEQVQRQLHLHPCTFDRTEVFSRPPFVLHVVDNDDAGMKIYYLGNYIMKNA